MSLQLRSWVLGLRDLWVESRSRPAFPLGSAAVAVYGFTAVFLLVCALSGPDRYRHLYFREGGLIDCVSATFLGCAAIFAWLNWKIGPRGRFLDSTFWIVTSAGLAFLALDERFQFHEQLDNRWLLEVYENPWFGKNWNDVIVVAYGVIAVAVFAMGIATVLRYRTLRGFLIAGFVFYAVHSTVDLLLERVSATYLVEESFKLLAGASFLLAFLQPFREQAGRWDSSRPWPRWTWVHASALLGLNLSLLYLVTLDDRSWQKILQTNWGSPAAWLVVFSFACAAVLVLVSRTSRTPDTRVESLCWAALGVVYGLTALTEVTVAARAFIAKGLLFNAFPDFLRHHGDLLHQDLNLQTIVLILLPVALIVPGYLFGFRNRRARTLAAISAVLVFLGILLDTVVSGGSGFRTVLRVGAATAALAAAISLVLSRAETGDPDEPK